MNAHTRKTYTSIVGTPAPRNLAWPKFVTLWEDIADRVEDESGDRLAVDFAGHREVFHRPHDGRVSIEDVERARTLLRSSPDLKGTGTVVAVTIDAKQARIVSFDLDSAKVVEAGETVRDHDPRAHHLRTVERHTGRDDEHDLSHFFDDLAEAVAADAPGQTFVVLGHGAGKSDVAEGFVERLRAHHAEVAEHVAGVANIDLSAADDAAIEAKALAVIDGSAD
ncbi:hypothetical protein [Tsukamurella soli]|uniref:Smr domain-containing protein n=1 Tax=Tsukamurella soli TaxID=644556 RepID=A0ABP8JZ06_9ACTN